MRHRLRAGFLFAWLAVLGLALAPTISHALARAQGQVSQAEICTPQGLKRLLLGDGSAAIEETGKLGTGVALDHCPFCGLSTQALPLPAQASLWPRAGRPPARLLPGRVQLPWPGVVLEAAQPRAPPACA